jgi:hypothetical protein
MEVMGVSATLSLVVLLGIAVKLYDLKRKREEEAVAAQARISDALLMDAALSGLPLTPTAHLPLWKGTPLVVEITGAVPRQELRRAEVDVATREISRRRSDFRIEDRIRWPPEDAPRSGRIVLVAVAGLVVSAPASASAGPPTDQLKASVEQILKVLEDPALKAEARAKDRRAAIRKEAEGVFDFTETAKRALGRHWQNLSDKDREEFTGLFTDLIERAYISKIEKYSGERIAYAGEAVDGFEGVTTASSRSREPRCRSTIACSSGAIGGSCTMCPSRE